LELRSLSVTAPRVQVLLSRTEAVAIGDRDSVAAVYQRWARTRQTTRYPSRNSALNQRSATFFYTSSGILSAAILTMAILAYFIPSFTPKPLDLGDFILFACVGILGIGYGCKYWLKDRRLASFAVIEPMKLAEYRERRPTRVFNRYTIAFSFVGLVIGMLTVVVAVMALK